MPLTINDTCKVQEDYCFSPERIDEMFDMATSGDEPGALIAVLAICERRGIDPSAHMEKAWAKHDKWRELITSKKRVNVSAKAFRVPIAF